MRTKSKLFTAIAAMIFAAYALFATGCSKQFSVEPVPPEVLGVSVSQ